MSRKHKLIPIAALSLLAALALVACASQAAKPAPVNHRLFLDVHHLGAGKVTAEAVAEAHQKDLAVEGDYGVHFLNYWVDEASGTVVCLSEAPDAAAVNAAHGAAHGLLADEVMEVTQGE